MFICLFNISVLIKSVKIELCSLLLKPSLLHAFMKNCIRNGAVRQLKLRVSDSSGHAAPHSGLSGPHFPNATPLLNINTYLHIIKHGCTVLWKRNHSSRHSAESDSISCSQTVPFLMSIRVTETWGTPPQTYLHLWEVFSVRSHPDPSLTLGELILV